MIVYLSGLYSKGDIAANIQAAREVAIQIWESGHVALTPHLNTAHFERDCRCQYEDYITGDLALLEGCDAILMLPGWKGSSGAFREWEHALALHIPVYEYPNCPMPVTDPTRRHRRHAR